MNRYLLWFFVNVFFCSNHFIVILASILVSLWNINLFHKFGGFVSLKVLYKRLHAFKDRCGSYLNVRLLLKIRCKLFGNLILKVILK